MLEFDSAKLEKSAFVKKKGVGVSIWTRKKLSYLMSDLTEAGEDSEGRTLNAERS